jgi:hypothetical protein
MSPILLSAESIQATDRTALALASAIPVESRLRGRVVDVKFDVRKHPPLRMHLYWQAAPRQLDLEILASSSELLEHAEVLTGSRHMAGEVLVRASHRDSGWINVRHATVLGAEWLVFPRDRVAGIISLDGRRPNPDAVAIAATYRQPIVLYRPARQRWSYAEMCRPHDCLRIIVRQTKQHTHVGFGLFGLDLEKGVILRGRLRGVFLPRSNDTARCLNEFARFAAEPPRLSV